MGNPAIDSILDGDCASVREPEEIGDSAVDRNHGDELAILGDDL